MKAETTIAKRKLGKSSEVPARYTLDALEKSLIRILREDARVTFQSIAQQLNIDEKTVRNRIAKLRQAGILQCTVTSDANLLHGCIVAFVGIMLQSHMRGRADEVLKELTAMPEVSWAGCVIGRYDILVEVVFDSFDSLTRFEVEEMPAIDGVGHTESFLIMSHHGRRGVTFVDRIID